MILRFKRGTAVFNLSTAPFVYGPDFAPPATAYETAYATGTSLNTTGGAVVARRAVSRDWTFTVLVTGNGQTAIEASIRRLEEFLATGAYSSESTYLEYSVTDFGEPSYGWFGAVRRYKILSSATPVIGPLFGNAVAREQAIEVSITLTIDPYATGPARRIGDATGTVTEPVGTDGASTGVSIAASSRLRIPVTAGVAEQASIAMAGGAALVVWKTGSASNASGNRFMFSCGNSSLRAYYNATDDKMYLTDNSNTISTAAQTFASGDTIRWLFTWGPTLKLKIYKNGVQVASGNTHTAPSAPSYIYMGTDASSANPALGTLTLTVWPTEPTAAQALLIDTEAATILAAGGRVDFTPWLSSPAGDGILDPYLDSDETNYVTVGGVPGSGPVKYAAHLVTPTSYAVAASGSCYIGAYSDPYSGGITAPSALYYEGSGTSEAGNSEGNYIAGLAASVTPGNQINALAAAAVFRGRASSGTNTFTARMVVRKNDTVYYGRAADYTTTTTYDLYYVPHIYIPRYRDNSSEYSRTISITTTTGALDRLDFAVFFPTADLLRFIYAKGAAPTVPLSIGKFDDEGVIGGGDSDAYTVSTALGSPPRLLPGHYNTFLFAGSHAARLEILSITPRWGLL